MVLLVGGLVGFKTVASAASVQADFNDDGFDDLAIGVPQEELGRATYAGAVNVIYGSASGLPRRMIRYGTRTRPAFVARRSSETASGRR